MAIAGLEYKIVQEHAALAQQAWIVEPGQGSRVPAQLSQRLTVVACPVSRGQPATVPVRQPSASLRMSSDDELEPAQPAPTAATPAGMPAIPAVSSSDNKADLGSFP